MRFEEILPVFREGKKIRREGWVYHTMVDLCIDTKSILADDWEIYEEPKQKVKYYPALITHSDCIHYLIDNRVFKNEEDAIKHYTYYSREEARDDPYKFVRLITEIPEMIEESED